MPVLFVELYCKELQRANNLAYFAMKEAMKKLKK
jgi:hypothetical protein